MCKCTFLHCKHTHTDRNLLINDRVVPATTIDDSGDDDDDEGEDD